MEAEMIITASVGRLHLEICVCILGWYGREDKMSFNSV